MIRKNCRIEKKRFGSTMMVTVLGIDFVVFSAKFCRSMFIVVLGFLEKKEKNMTSWSWLLCVVNCVDLSC